MTLSVLSGISGNSEQKTIFYTTEHQIQYTVLEIQFRGLKYPIVIRIHKTLSNTEEPTIPIQAIRDENSVLM